MVQTLKIILAVVYSKVKLQYAGRVRKGGKMGSLVYIMGNDQPLFEELKRYLIW
jgi:hypothetical protein